MPLGGELVDLIETQLRREREWLNRPQLLRKSPLDFELNLRDACHKTSAFHEFPIYVAAFSSWLMPDSSFSPEAAREALRLQTLEQLLSDQTSESIDDFIVENPSVADLTKVAIGAMLLRASYVPATDTLPACRLRAFQARMTDPPASVKRNWIHLLINIVRQGVRRNAVTERNKIQIITFNYDTILEHVLEKQFSNTELGRGHWSEYFEIVHVHGQFGSMADDLANPAPVARSWGEAICVVNEDKIPAKIEAARERAKEMIAAASHIYVAGFAFAGANCRLLGLHALPEAPPKHIHFLNYDGNAGVRLSAEKWKRSYTPEVNTYEVPGSPDRAIGVVDWLRAGYLGELPG